MSRDITLVRTGGLEPPRLFRHWDLNPARLPVPPRPHGRVILVVPTNCCDNDAGRRGWGAFTR